MWSFRVNCGVRESLTNEFHGDRFIEGDIEGCLFAKRVLLKRRFRVSRYDCLDCFGIAPEKSMDVRLRWRSGC